MNSKQLHLNLEPPSARGLKTRATSNLIFIVAQQSVSPDEVRKRLKHGGFSIQYRYGILNVIPSKLEKQGRFCLADVEFLPTSTS